MLPLFLDVLSVVGAFFCVILGVYYAGVFWRWLLFFSRRLSDLECSFRDLED